MSSSENDEVVSKSFYIMRMLAIISVATAHCSSYIGFFPETLRQMIGTIGVPIFFISSGYYFKPVKTVYCFLEKRKSVIIPWVIFGILTYALEGLKVGRFSGEGLIRWIFGYKTWLYYVPVLICFYILFQLFNSNIWIAIWEIVFLFFFCLSTLGIIMEDNGWITLYQIPFNNIGFFAAGIALKRYGIEKVICCTIRKKTIVIIAFLLISVLYLNSGQIGYWESILSIPFELLSSIVVLWISRALSLVEIFIDVGKHTYFIYFIHMQIVIYIVSKMLIITKLNNVIPEIVLLFIKPLLIVSISYLIWRLLNIIARKMNITNLSWIIAV